MKEAISTAPRQGRSISVREYLKTKQGKRWLTDTKSHMNRSSGNTPSGLIGGIGTALDIVSWIQKITGIGNNNITPADLARMGDEILRAIKQSQEQLSGQIGQVGETVDQIPAQIEELEDLVKEMREAEEVGDTIRHAEIVQMLDVILLEQRQNTLQILNSINVVGEKVTGMWNDMNKQFGEMMEQLSEITNMLTSIASQLSEIIAAIQQAIEGIEEVKKKIDFSTVIGMINEHQARITYAIDMAYEINISPIEEPSSFSDENPEESPTVSVNKEELLEWARKTADLTNDLPYHLYCFHRALLGDNLFGKSFFESHFGLFIGQRNTLGPSVARIILNIVALQAQGFGALDKARQILELPALDYSQTLLARVEEQVRLAISQLAEVLHLDEENLLISEDRTTYKVISFIVVPEWDEECLYCMVPGPNNVLSVMDIWTRPYFQFGTIKPGERKLENITSGYLLFPESNIDFDFGWIWPFKRELNSSYFDAREINIDPQYAIVGFQFLRDNGDQIGRIVPVVSPVDEEGNTKWDGVEGEIYLAEQSPKSEYMQRYEINGEIQLNGYMIEKAWKGGRMTGMRMVCWYNEGGSTVRVLLKCFSTMWEESTGLPSQRVVPDSEVTYKLIESIPAAQRLGSAHF
ncbi:hypothetical protein BOTCAL_0485g00060 [Botryotinia calthae]|uniref:Uncharacterized protein n=1 Tax=Botryotinia calthae TaxID=38488 RepID=A0A4Y8CLV0_9HELO|nr:hypothetical protein BOTCAL_0485g00060 [Botryotinia calthae]